jgi:hypothetical protein
MTEEGASLVIIVKTHSLVVRHGINIPQDTLKIHYSN